MQVHTLHLLKNIHVCSGQHFYIKYFFSVWVLWYWRCHRGKNCVMKSACFFSIFVETRHYTHALQSSVLNILCPIPCSLFYLASFITTSHSTTYLSLSSQSFPWTIFSYPNPPLLSTWVAQIFFLMFYRFLLHHTPVLPTLPSPHPCPYPPLSSPMPLPSPPQIMLHPLDSRITFKDRTIWPGFSSLLLYRPIDCISAPIGKIPSTNISWRSCWLFSLNLAQDSGWQE